MKHSIEYVTWLDHAKSEDPKGLKPAKRHTVGWVIKETDEYIVLAMDRNGKNREYGFAIVKTLILERRPFGGR